MKGMICSDEWGLDQAKVGYRNACRTIGCRHAEGVGVLDWMRAIGRNLRGILSCVG